MDLNQQSLNKRDQLKVKIALKMVRKAHTSDSALDILRQQLEIPDGPIKTNNNKYNTIARSSNIPYSENPPLVVRNIKEIAKAAKLNIALTKDRKQAEIKSKKLSQLRPIFKDLIDSIKAEVNAEEERKTKDIGTSLKIYDEKTGTYTILHYCPKANEKIPISQQQNDDRLKNTRRETLSRRPHSASVTRTSNVIILSSLQENPPISSSEDVIQNNKHKTRPSTAGSHFPNRNTDKAPSILINNVENVKISQTLSESNFDLKRQRVLKNKEDIEVAKEQERVKKLEEKKLILKQKAEKEEEEVLQQSWLVIIALFARMK
jgi:hypothetical protein